VRFFNDRGELLLEEMGDTGALALNPHAYKPILGGDHQVTVSFEAREDEKFYGMGQYQNGCLNLKHTVLELAHRNSQSSVPFCLSSRGYGFLWHNPAVGTATFAKNYTQWTADSTKGVDYWVTAGDTPAQILSNYADATGHVPLMPEYGLGFWQCKLRYWNQEQLLDVAREYHRRGLPVDVIVCDFFHWPYMGDYRFDEEFFPDPEAMCRELNEMGTELMVSVWPQVDLRSENFREMKDRNLLIRQELGVPVSMQFQGDSLFFDATNPEARKYVWEKCRANYAEKGVKLFWLDEAEPEFGVYDYANYRYYAGPGPQVTNWYPQQYSRAFYEGMR
jgi:alpha-D-xyloside xylohydrolase